MAGSEGLQRFASFVRFCVVRGGWVLSFWALVAVWSGFGIARLEFATTPSSFLDRLSEGWAFYQTSLDRFGGDEIIVLAWDAPSPWDPQALAEVVTVTRELEGLPGVRRVDSLSTVPVVRGRPDGALDLSPALPDRPGVPDGADPACGRTGSALLVPSPHRGDSTSRMQT